VEFVGENEKVGPMQLMLSVLVLAILILDVLNRGIVQRASQRRKRSLLSHQISSGFPSWQFP
jgi:hypothetical protein